MARGVGVELLIKHEAKPSALSCNESYNYNELNSSLISIPILYSFPVTSVYMAQPCQTSVSP